MKRNAFTLVEILIVIVILGILGTIAIINMSGVVEEKKDVANKTLILAVTNAVQNYRMKVDDSTATPSISTLQSNGLVTADFAGQWSISYSGGQVSDVVAK